LSVLFSFDLKLITIVGHRRESTQTKKKQKRDRNSIRTVRTHLDNINKYIVHRIDSQ
jgi:hypothetical protein